MRAAVIVSGAVLVFTAIALLMPIKVAAEILSIVLLLLIGGSFCGFLLSVGRGRGGRSLPSIFIFLVVNVTSLILLFANLFRWTGLTDPLVDKTTTTTLPTAIYFSIVTWTTVGYGDVTPSAHARIFAAAEALSGYVVMGILIAILITAFQD